MIEDQPKSVHIKQYNQKLNKFLPLQHVQQCQIEMPASFGKNFLEPIYQYYEIHQK